MKITNKAGLPEALVNAVRNDSYNRGKSDISVTQLIDSPYIRFLRKQHREELEEDVADRIWSLMGQSIHTILERANLSGLVEQRLFVDIGTTERPLILSGQFDHLENGILTDYKMTSVWAVIYGKADWGRQLNVLAYMCRVKGMEVKKLQIVAILRDWSKSKVGKDDNYPNTQVVAIPIEMWTPERQEEYILERKNAHFYESNPCTDEERWAKPGKFAVMKKGRKSALRLLDSTDEAHKWVADNFPDSALAILPTSPEKLPKDTLYINQRPATYGRCESYCNVSKFCPVWQEYIKKLSPDREAA